MSALRCARFADLLQNFSERLMLWRLCSIVFLAFTLKLPIQTTFCGAYKISFLAHQTISRRGSDSSFQFWVVSSVFNCYKLLLHVACHTMGPTHRNVWLAKDSTENWKQSQYRSGMVNSNMVNSKFHFLWSFCEMFSYHFMFKIHG